MRARGASRGRRRVGVNLCGFDTGAPAAADHALLGALHAMSDAPPGDLDVVLFAGRDLVAAHPELATTFETHAMPVPPGAAALRLAIERSALRAAVARAHLDVLHDMERPTPGAARVARVVSVHDATTVARQGRAARTAVQQARRVVVPSTFVRGRLVDRFGVDGSRVQVVPWPLPPHEQAAPIDTVRARHGIIGQIVLLAATASTEDHVVAVRAMRHLAGRHKETTLVLLGEVDRGERAVQDAIRSHGLEERVVRVPTVSGPVRSALYEHATVVVSSVVHDGFADDVLEAMACGVPVVVADAGAAPELAVDAGAVVPPGDEVQLALEVHRVLEDPRWRAGMVEAGLDRARTHTPQRTAEALLAAYRSVLADL